MNTGLRTGLKVLVDFLAQQSPPLDSLDLDGFRAWIEARVREESRDPIFRQRNAIREIKRQNSRRLRYRQRAVEHAREALELTPAHIEGQAIERELDGLAKAIDGLSEAISSGRSPAAPGREKLAGFIDRQRALRARQQALGASSSEHHRLESALAKQRELHAALGLTEAQSALGDSQQARGRQASKAGHSFEHRVMQHVTDHITPHALDGAVRDQVRCLTGVTLGCARGELDQVVVALREGAPVEVLAVVESKRNINDLGHGYSVRQENLAWFVGDHSGYQAELYRTQCYRQGHFDQPATHTQHGIAYRFDQTSFERFRRASLGGPYLDGLYFCTRARPLRGLSSGEYSMLMSRVSTDPRLDLASEYHLRRLRRWLLGRLAKVQARDVLMHYAVSQRRAEQILFCG